MTAPADRAQQDLERRLDRLETALKLIASGRPYPMRIAREALEKKSS